MLPRATHYLVHPVLSEVIGQVNPAYPGRIDRTNVVGYGRPWQGTRSVDAGATPRTLCVLAADVQGFGGLMRAGADAPVRRALEEAVRMSAKDAVCAETGPGDAVLIIHDDPVALGRAARHLVDQVYGAPGQPRLRVALHHGEVLTRRRESDGATIAAGGRRCCARRAWSRTWSPGRSGRPRSSVRSLPSSRPCGVPRPSRFPAARSGSTSGRATRPTCGFGSTDWSSERRKADRWTEGADGARKGQPR